MEFKFVDVNDAFFGLVSMFHNNPTLTVESDSRNGPVRYVQEPVMITYLKPKQNVLVNRARDTNPFFHLFESLWMLAGKDDVDSVAYFASNIRNYSDDGVFLNGAYGRRWRYAPGNCTVPIDQIEIIIDHFVRQPLSRRAVLTMWNIDQDLARIESSKDVCCNTHVYFLLRESSEQKTIGGTFNNWKTHPMNYELDMTVCNRSNDLIWGTLGANVVHFSFLQEYVANRLGVKVGRYNQFTNNLHYYLNNWNPEAWLEDTTESPYQVPWFRCPLFTSTDTPDEFNLELRSFIHKHSNDKSGKETDWTSPYLTLIAEPMICAFHLHKQRRYEEAYKLLRTVDSPDWATAGTNWLKERERRWKEKQDERREPYCH